MKGTEPLVCRAASAASDADHFVFYFQCLLGLFNTTQEISIMAEERADEQGSVIQVLENANWEHVQRMFPYQAGTGGLGRILRIQASSGMNPSAEVRLKIVADERRYDNIVCGLLSFRSEFRGSCFPLTPVVRQRAVWMTCQRVTKGGVETPLLVGSAVTAHFLCLTRRGTQDEPVHKS